MNLMAIVGNFYPFDIIRIAVKQPQVLPSQGFTDERGQIMQKHHIRAHKTIPMHFLPFLPLKGQIPHIRIFRERKGIS